MSLSLQTVFIVMSQFEDSPPDVEAKFKTKTEAERFIGIVQCCYLVRRFYVKIENKVEWIPND